MQKVQRLMKIDVAVTQTYFVFTPAELSPLTQNVSLLASHVSGSKIIGGKFNPNQFLRLLAIAASLVKSSK